MVILMPLYVSVYIRRRTWRAVHHLCGSNLSLYTYIYRYLSLLEGCVSVAMRGLSITHQVAIILQNPESFTTWGTALSSPKVTPVGSLLL